MDEFFGQAPRTDEPLRNLAEFLAWHMADQGRHNSFFAPLKLVIPFLEDWGFSFDPRRLILALKELMDANRFTNDEIEEVLRSCVSH